MNNVVSVAAATAAVGYDLLQDEWFKSTPEPRVITGVGFTGSAAAGDTEIELFIDNIKVGNFFNSATGFPNRDEMIPQDNLFVPGGSTLHAYVVDAALTNPVFLQIETTQVR